MSDIFTILFSSLFTAILFHILAEEREHLSRRNESSRNFRNAFSTEIQALSVPFDKQIDITNILQTAFAKHYVALQEFNLFLSKDEIDRLNFLWHEYCEHEDIYPDFDQYGTRGVDNKERIQKRELAYNRINKMIIFAEPKRHWITLLFLKAKEKLDQKSKEITKRWS